MTEHKWIGDLLGVYLIGLFLGVLVGFIRWAIDRKLGFFEALAPAVVWPIALLKESWKYLKN